MTDPGNGAVGGEPEVLFDRPKMFPKVCVVKDPRRGRGEPSATAVLPLEDMMEIGEDRCWKERKELWGR